MENYFTTVEDLIHHLKDVKESIIIEADTFLNESIIKKYPYAIQLDTILEYLEQIRESQILEYQNIEPIAQFSDVESAINFRDRQFESASISSMIIKISDARYEIHTRRNALIFRRAGFEIL